MNIGTNVYLRKVASQDQTEFLQLMRASMDIHRPWITPPTTPQMFRNYLQRIRRSDHEGYAICRTDDDRIVGVININHIVRGTFQNASLGYYVGEPYQGHGYMQQGLEQLLRLAFPPWACTVWRRTSSQTMPGQKPWSKAAASTLKGSAGIFCTSTVNGETTNAGLSLLTAIPYDHDRRSELN